MSTTPNNDPAWLQEKAAIEDTSVATAGDVDVLTAKNVETIFYDCFLTHTELDAEGKALVPYIEVEGILNRFGFSPERVAKHAPKIKALLDCLPAQFRVDAGDAGGGWSFLNACVTKDGVQWGEHQNIEQLVALGLATGYVTYLMPKSMWRVMPGGMPYFSIFPEPQPVKTTTPAPPVPTGN